MTNEEAKEILNTMYGDWRTDEEREAIEVAINALGSWDKYSSELWKIAYDRGFKDGVRDGTQAME